VWIEAWKERQGLAFAILKAMFHAEAKAVNAALLCLSANG
jgi:hypothetical protein